MPRGFGTCRVGEARWREDVVEQALALLTALGYHGIAQTEFRLDPRDGRFKLMEVNPAALAVARPGARVRRRPAAHRLSRRARPPAAAGALGPAARRPPLGRGRRAPARLAAGGHARCAARCARSGPHAVEGTFDIRDPLPAIVQASGLVTAPIARALRRGRGGARVIALRPWLDRLLLATLVVTTWHKLHWAPGAGRRHARGRPRRRLRRRSSSSIAACAATARMHRVALGLLLAMAVLEVVYLGGYFALENQQQLSQYAKGMAKFALHFALPRVRHAARDRPRRAAAAPHDRRVRARARRSTAPTASSQLAAQVGGGRQPRQAP